MRRRPFQRTFVAVVALLAVGMALAMPPGVCLTDLLGEDCCTSEAAAGCSDHGCCETRVVHNDHEHDEDHEHPMDVAACRCASLSAPRFVLPPVNDSAEAVLHPVVVAVIFPVLDTSRLLSMASPVAMLGLSGCGSPPSGVSCILRI